MGWYRNYPHGGPPEYSYTGDFVTKFPKTGGEAIMNQTMGSLEVQDSFTNPAIVVQLQSLVDAARAAELAFLNKYNLGNPGNNWGELIRAFNEFLSTRQAFETNLRLLSQIQGSKRQEDTYHDFTTHISSYLQTAARDLISRRMTADFQIQDMDKLLDDIIESALKRLFNQSVWKLENGTIKTNPKKTEKENAEEIKLYQNLQSQLKSFTKNKVFMNNMRDLFELEQFVNKTIAVKKNNANATKRSALPLIKSSFKNGNVKGTFREYVETVIAEAAGRQLQGRVGGGDMELSWRAEHSGTSGVKADVILVQGGIPDIQKLMTQAGEDDSNRVNAINHYRDFFDKMKEAQGEIVFISDKNYQIKNNFKGFTAQDKVTLANLGALLNAVDAPFQVDSLIDYLANCGSDMMLGRAESDVLDAVATQIGHFLFDDLTITGGSINRIHLLNLSGIYLPLSVYLEGMLQAVQAASEDVKQFVTVSFRPDGNSPDGWSENAFNKFRAGRVEKSTINVNFMRNFASFITSQVHI